MQELLSDLELADYQFLVGIIEGGVGLPGSGRLRSLLDDLEEDASEPIRVELNRHLEREVRYLGSADLAYVARLFSGREPGVPFREVAQDVARALKVEVPRAGTDREQAEQVVEAYVSQQLARMPREEQQRVLEDMGVDRDKAAAFLKRSAGVFTIPLLVQAFGTLVVEGLVKRVVFGTITRIIGRQLSAKLFELIAGRFPWWVRWVGPAAWTVSIGWTVLDLQGPAMRKTIPVVLYLGLCSARRQAD